MPYRLKQAWKPPAFTRALRRGKAIQQIWKSALHFRHAAFVAALLALSVSALAESNLPSDDAINSILTKCVTEQNRAPGIVVGVIDATGARVFAKGTIDYDDPKPVTGDSVFEIGSVSKVFTSLLLEEMVERGELKLDDPVGKFLPSTAKMPSRNGRQITLVDLATQTSGLPRLPDNLDSKDFNNPYADYTAENLYEYLAKCQLQRDIGSQYEYSNLGVGLLGHALALRAKSDYETLLVNRICNPLHMNSTRIALSPEMKTRLALGHNAAGFVAENWDVSVFAGAGGIRSTVNDMLKFMAANAGLSNSPLSHAMAVTHEPRYETGPGGKIGLIWQIRNSSGVVWHNGGTGGYHSYIGMAKNPNRAVVVLANSANDIDDIGQYILGDRADVKVFDAPKHHKLAKIDPKVFDDYVGIYQFTGAAVTLTMTRDGDHFFAQMTGQDKFEVFPESATDFFFKIVDAQLTFERGADKSVSAVILHQNGIDQRVTRIK